MSQVYFWRGDYYKNCLPLQNPGQLPAAEVNFEAAFLMFSRGWERVHWEQMGYVDRIFSYHVQMREQVM